MSDKNETLLDKVKRLYTEIFLTALQERIHSYHACADPNKSHNFSDTLHELVNEIVKEVSKSHSVFNYQDIKTLDDTMLSASDHLEYIKTYTSKFNEGAESELASYLANKIVEGNKEHLADKLQRSVQEHVFAAHRYARSGQGSIAKLHADLVTNALNTLSHYMTVDDYSRFVVMIDKQLHSMDASMLYEIVRE